MSLIHPRPFQSLRREASIGGLPEGRSACGELGRVVERSVESNIRWSGLTDNYIRVYAESERDLANTLCPARLCALEGDGTRGEVLELA